MTVGFLTPFDYRGIGKLIVDAQFRLWGAAGWCNCLDSCDFRQAVFLVSRLIDSGEQGACYDTMKSKVLEPTTMCNAEVSLNQLFILQVVFE